MFCIIAMGSKQQVKHGLSLLAVAYQIKLSNHVSFKRINNKDCFTFHIRLKTQTADLYNLSRQQALSDRIINRTHFLALVSDKYGRIFHILSV